MSFPEYPDSGVRWHGSCCVCAGRIVIPGDKRCAKCMIEWAEKQHELRRLQDIQKQIAFESAHSIMHLAQRLSPGMTMRPAHTQHEPCHRTPSGGYPG